MAETHDIQIRVDASQAKRELASFQGALTKTQQTVASMAAASSGGGFSSLASQIKQLSSGFQQLKNVAGLNALAKDITNLNTALGAFKAPSATNVANIVALGKALGGMGRVSFPRGIGQELQSIGNALGSIRAPNIAALRTLPQFIAQLNGLQRLRVAPQIAADVNALGSAFTNFRVPQASSIQNIARFAAAINGFRINPQSAQGFTQFGQAVSGLRGSLPTAGGINNLTRLVQVLSSGNPAAVAAMARALSSLRLPANIGAGARVNVNQTQRATNAPQNSGWLKTLAGDSNGARTALKGLENQFSATYHVSSLLRVAMGSLTLGQFAKGVQETGNDFLTLERSMAAVASTQEETGQHMKFIDDLTRSLPISLKSAIQSYQQFAVSTRSAGMSVQDTQDIFKGFATAFAGMGLGADKQKLAFLALEQIVTKGKFAMQELRQQLGNNLPGVISVLAQSLGKTAAETERLLEKGLSSDKLVGMAKVEMQIWQGTISAAMRQGAAQMQMFENEYTRFQNNVFKGGFNAGVATMFETLTGAFKTSGMDDLAASVGMAFGRIFVMAGALGKVLIENKDAVIAFGAAFATWAAIGGAIKLLMMLVSPVALVAAAIGVVIYAFLNWEDIVKDMPGWLGTTINVIGKLASALDTLARKFWAAIPDSLKERMSATMDRWGEAMSDWANNDNKGFNEASGVEQGDQYGKAIGKSATDAATSQMQSGAGKAREALTSWIEKGREMFKNSGFGQFFEQLDKNQKELAATMDATNLKMNQQREIQNAIDRKTKFTTDENAYLKKLNPAIGAAEELKNAFEKIEQMKHVTEGPNAMTPAKVKEMQEIAKFQALPQVDPTAGVVRSMMDELRLAKLTGDAREEETKMLAIKNELMAKGVKLQGDEEAKVRALVKAQIELSKGGNNGFSQWAHGVKDFKDALNDGVKTSLDNIADSLADMVVTGKMDLASLAQSILKTFASVAIKSLMKDAMAGVGSLFSSNVDSAMAGGKAILDGADKKMNALMPSAATTTAEMNVTAATVNINGVTTGAGLPSAGVQTLGTPTSTSISSIDPSKVGGTGAMGALPSIAPQGTVMTLDSDMRQGASNWDLSGGVGAAQGQYIPSIDQAVPTIGSGFANGQGFGMFPLALAPAAAALAAARPSISGATAFGTGGFNAAGAGGRALAAAPSGDIIADVAKAADPAKQAAAIARLGGAQPYAPLPPVRSEAATAIEAQTGGAGTFNIGSKVNLKGFDPRLQDILKKTATEKGYNAELISATREGDKRFHGLGKAGDIQLRDANGKVLNNYQDGKDFRAYEQFAQDARETQMRDHPELAQDFRWGGYFSGEKGKYGAMDSMHFDLAGKRVGMGGGSWADGLTPAQRRNFPTAQSVGMNQKRADLPSENAVPVSGKLSEADGLMKDGFVLPGTNPGALDARAMSRSPSDFQGNGSTGSAWDNAYREPGTHEGVMDPTSTPMWGRNPVGFGGTGSGWQNQLGAPGADMGGMATPQGSMALNQAMESSAAKFTTAMNPATQTVGQSLEQNLTQATSQIGQQGGAGLSGLTNQVGELGGAAQGAQGGLGSLLQSLSQMGGGGGGGGGGGLGMLGGLFKEGGMSSSPVSMGGMSASSWHGAPHYAEGTPNTSGGIPAILHDNEAVIPLSRGRNIPVEMKGGPVKNLDNGSPVVNNFHFHGVKDHDSFRRSKDQVAAGLASQQQRAAQSQG